MAYPLALHWVKSTQEAWLDLKLVDLSSVTAEGVYVIWKSIAPGKVVRVGQGGIADRLYQHRHNPLILRHKPDKGTLFVTWASVREQDRGGVERFLAELYAPLEGDRFPDVRPIQVNLPA